MAKVVFKKDNSNQLMLLPLDLGSLVPEKHVVKVIDKIINELTLSPLPTYFGFQWKELGEIGQKIGLSEKESNDSINSTLIASLKLMFKSGLSPHEVMDLIPVKPIGEHEAQIAEIYNTKLIGLFEKIKP
jgi:hypothetical protein